MSATFGFVFDPALDYAPPALSAGVYNLKIKDMTWKTPKSGEGNMLVVKFEILFGQYEGRTVTDNLNLVHVNATAVEIAKRRLKEIFDSLGINKPVDLTQDSGKALFIDQNLSGVLNKDLNFTKYFPLDDITLSNDAIPF